MNSHFTTPDKVRKVEPCSLLTLFREEADRGPRHELTSQARPASAIGEPGHKARLTLTIDGKPYKARVELHDPGDNRPVQHVIDLEYSDADRCRVAYNPDDGLVGTCDDWKPEAGCVHSNAAYAVGLFPELAIVPTIAARRAPCR